MNHNTPWVLGIGEILWDMLPDGKHCGGERKRAGHSSNSNFAHTLLQDTKVQALHFFLQY